MMRIIFIYLFLVGGGVAAQNPGAPKPYGVLPTPRQLVWHEMEMYCLIHFGVDTYTDKEWGYGDEDPALVNPVNFDAEQIVGAARAGGFKGVVIVAKHHDGLCLWPTKTTEHNITKSPWKGGKGDMVKEYQLACKKLGMRLGLYCSPWDRNNVSYGTAAYVKTYRAQLKELYTNYGPLFMSWHDGANGGDGYYGGTRETRKIDRTSYYGWDTTWAMIRQLQPGAVLFGDIGPDVRWVGNEEGHAGTTCWATYTPQAPDAGKKPANGYSKYWEATEGTRNGEFWLPAECDVPLRPGWFYHSSQDQQVKSPYQLLDLYYQSVGRGADLDLGLAPDRNGRLDQHDVASLQGFGDLLRKIFSVNLAKGAAFTASNIRGGNKQLYGPSRLVDDDRYSYWATDDSVTTPQLVVDLGKPVTFNVIRLRENIKLGQRIDSFAVDAFLDGGWKKIAAGTSIGAGRLIRLQQNVVTGKVRLRVNGSGACVALSDLGLFKEPAHLVAPSILRDREGWVSLVTISPVASIHYTLDGTEPGVGSPLYKGPFSLKESGVVKARSFEGDNTASEVSIRELGLSKSGWRVMGPVADSGGNGASGGGGGKAAGGETSDGGGRYERAIDEDERTVWSTLQRDSLVTAKFPQDISIDMGKEQAIKAFTYLPRQDKRTEGIVDQYVFYVSGDGVNWQKVAEGEFSNIKSNPLEQVVQLGKAVTTRYFKFSVLHVVGGNGVVVAELGVVGGQAGDKVGGQAGSKPWKGLPQVLPGRVECELYDEGGEGIAYHDADSINHGSGKLNPANGKYLNEFRMKEGVDISYTKSGDIDDNNYNLVKPLMDQLYVGWTVPGEWINYTVMVKEAGFYRIGLMYTSNKEGCITLSMDGRDIAGKIRVPTTYRVEDTVAWRQWHHWNKVDSIAGLRLDKGIHVLRLYSVSGDMNYDYIEFKR